MSQENIGTAENLNNVMKDVVRNLRLYVHKVRLILTTSVAMHSHQILSKHVQTKTMRP